MVSGFRGFDSDFEAMATAVAAAASEPEEKCENRNVLYSVDAPFSIIWRGPVFRGRADARIYSFSRQHRDQVDMDVHRPENRIRFC